MSSPELRATFRIRDVVIDVAAYELRRDGRAVRLERQPMDLLILLVERRGQLVSRGEIVDALWGKDVFVDVETGVHTAIRKIRQALRDPADAPIFIETVPGKGYRFIGPVEVLPFESAPSGRGRAGAGDRPSRRRPARGADSPGRGRSARRAQPGGLVDVSILAAILLAARLPRRRRRLVLATFGRRLRRRCASSLPCCPSRTSAAIPTATTWPTVLPKTRSCPSGASIPTTSR